MRPAVHEVLARRRAELHKYVTSIDDELAALKERVAELEVEFEAGQAELADINAALEEDGELVSWCSTHDRRMKGVRVTGNWACEAFYEPGAADSILDGMCALEEIPAASADHRGRHPRPATRT